MDSSLSCQTPRKVQMEIYIATIQLKPEQQDKELKAVEVFRDKAEAVNWLVESVFAPTGFVAQFNDCYAEPERSNFGEDTAKSLREDFAKRDDTFVENWSLGQRWCLRIAKRELH